MRKFVNQQAICKWEVNIATNLQVTDFAADHKLDVSKSDFSAFNQEQHKLIDVIKRIAYMINGEECLISTRSMKDFK